MPDAYLGTAHRAPTRRAQQLLEIPSLCCLEPCRCALIIDEFDRYPCRAACPDLPPPVVSEISSLEGFRIAPELLLQEERVLTQRGARRGDGF